MTSRRARAATQGRLVGLGLVVVAAVAGMLTLGYTAQNGLPGQPRHHVDVWLPTVANMTRHDPVRVGGRRVGQIVSVTAHRGAAKVGIEIDDTVWPLPSGTVALPRARSALGQSFLEIRPGAGAGAIPEGGRIGAVSDAEPVGLDQVLSTFEPRVRAQTRALLGQLATGVAARGPEVARTLAIAPGALLDVGAVTRAINRRDQPLGRFLDGARVAATAAAPVADAFARGLRPEAATLAAVPAEADATRRALTLAPVALEHVKNDLRPVNRILAELTGLARESRPLLNAAPDSLRRTATLLPVGGRGLASLDRALRELSTAIPPTMTLLRTFSPVATPAIQTLDGGRNTVRDLGTRPCDLKRWLANWGGTDGVMAFRSGAGAFLRVTPVTQAPLTGTRAGGNEPSVYELADSDCRSIR